MMAKRVRFSNRAKGLRAMSAEHLPDRPTQTDLEHFEALLRQAASFYELARTNLPRRIYRQALRQLSAGADLSVSL
jgi:hypothetical protein